MEQAAEWGWAQGVARGATVTDTVISFVPGGTVAGQLLKGHI